MVETVQTFVLTYGLRFVGALVIFVVGRWAAGFLSRLAEQGLIQMKTEATLVRFTKTLVYYIVFFSTILAALRNLGVETTSLVALVGAASLAVGLALEGALSNFAAGVLLLLFRPFKVGDLVELAGTLGHVKEIQIFSTIVITLDNITAIVPNSQVTGSPIKNYSAEGVIRLDMVFGIGYGDDLLKAKRVLEDILRADGRVVHEPAYTVAVLELADNSVNFAVRPYVVPDDYWPVHFAVHEAVKLRFDEEGISIPFPQRDVHLYQTAVN